MVGWCGRVYHGTDGKVCEGVVTEAYASSRVRMLMDEHMGHRTKLWYACAANSDRAR